MVMNIEEIDGTMQRLGEAADLISANLLEIEADPNRKLLEAAALGGESAKRWAEASATLTQLWEWYGLLAALLERAQKLRGKRARLSSSQLAKLSDLLEGPSIQFSSQHVPLDQRDLLGGSQAQLRCTPTELLAHMSRAFDETKATIAAFDRVWSTFGPRLRAVEGQFRESRELARALGDSEPPELERARARLAELSKTMSNDSLSVSAAQIDSLESSVDAIRRDLGGLDEVRREFSPLLEGARSLLAELRQSVREGEEAYAEVLAKIAAPTVPEPLALDGLFEAQLDDVAEISASGAWREARAALKQWTLRAQSLLDQARRITAENRAPIEERNQLRGRLDAYQAKAAKLLLIENLEVAKAFDQAHEALYAAPTDLARAAELVRCYQQALEEKSAGEEKATGEVLR